MGRSTTCVSEEPGHVEWDPPAGRDTHQDNQMIKFVLEDELTARIATSLAQRQKHLLKPLLIVPPALGLEDQRPLSA